MVFLPYNCKRVSLKMHVLSFNKLNLGVLNKNRMYFSFREQYGSFS